MRPLVFIILLMLLTFTVYAQESECPAFIETSLVQVDTLCTGTERNQACYGNLELDAEPQPNVTAFTFAQPGDTANVIDIHELRLSALDQETETWGIALMQLQANLPDTMPGQNVTVLLFGDVSLRTDDSSEDLAPMQAFYLQTGIGDAPCASLPESGALIQTPNGAAQVELMVNGVHVALGSTAYLQANDTLDIYLLEGQAEVTALDVTQIVPSGMFTSVPLDENGTADGEPTEPQPYDDGFNARFEDMASLLPETVTLTTCTVTGADTVNVRSGPGTAYDIVEQLAADQSANVDGQAVGSDGLTWWQLSDGRWVRSDVVAETGSCESLPTVTTIPPLPTPIPTLSPAQLQSGQLVYFNLNGPGTCTPNPPIYQLGTRYQISFGRPASTGEEADAAVAAGTSSITINGQLVPAYRLRADCPADGGGGTCTPGTPGYWTQFIWIPTEAGTYTISGTGDHIRDGVHTSTTDTCTITIEG